VITVAEFISRWQNAAPSERGHAQQFFLELCAVLNVPTPPPRPANVPEDAYFTPYGFERPVDVAGSSSKKFIDFFRDGAFVIEAKQYGDERTRGVTRGTERWRRLMIEAFGQGARYAQSLPGQKVPFLVVCDVGHCFEIWSDFSLTGSYGGYGARQVIRLDELAQDDVRARLRLMFLDPMSLNPALRAARVTREVAARLAALARKLEADQHDPEAVARFLMRCLFTMFAEDVQLLGDKLFTRALKERWVPQPERFPLEVIHLWQAMEEGTQFYFERLLRFNGGLFKSPSALPLSGEQLHELLDAAQCDWSAVEPSIFGTLLERALDPVKRAELGAHFTPREYIERLVVPTVIEPLREEWGIVQTAARVLIGDGEPTAKARDEAIRLLRDFHARLCRLRVLDPACGSGNFLYVTYDLLKRLEAEVLRELYDLARQRELITLMPSQFLGLERNVRAREVADLVLWIGHLQWQQRTTTDKPREPVLEVYKNIVAQDAVLAWERQELLRDDEGRVKKVWDMRSTRPDPVTGEPVPDTQNGMIPLYRYIKPRAPEWPEADFIVGNPPFIGDKMMRQTLGDGYTEALREAWPHLGQNADLVMYWWDRAAALVRAGKVRRFGFITTNSITQVFNRRVMEAHLQAEHEPLDVIFAIGDHPWVDTGAAVRIAMTVGARRSDVSQQAARVGRVSRESASAGDIGAALDVAVEIKTVPRVNVNLSFGTDVVSVRPLRANLGLTSNGMLRAGSGFVLEAADLAPLGYTPTTLPPVIRPYMNARDLMNSTPHRFIIDLYSLTAEEARDAYPTIYQRVLELVKPERDQNKRATYKARWWQFAEPRSRLRQSLVGLKRYIITPETSKHRVFTFAPLELCPDHMLYAVCLDQSWHLGVLCSRPQTVWSLAAGAWMGIGNDPRWRNGTCFDPFPFPAATPAQEARIGALAERLDQHRRDAQARDTKAHLTAQYNALARLREAQSGGTPLTPAERAAQGVMLTAVLAGLHDDLDAAVAEAYGWPVTLTDEELLERLVALNAERAAEEAAGTVRYLRPELQASAGEQLGLVRSREAPEADDDAPESAGAVPWPKELMQQIAAVLAVVRPRAAPWTFAEITRAFKGARRETLRAQLDGLTLMGQLVAVTEPVEGWRRG
jgi:hypothetical protein